MVSCFMFSCTRYDGSIKERVKLLNKNAAYKITDACAFSKLVADKLEDYIKKDKKIPLFEKVISIHGNVKYEDENIFNTKSEFINKIQEVNNLKFMKADWLLTKPKSFEREKEYRFMWMFGNKDVRARFFHIHELPYDFIDLKIQKIKNIVKRFNIE